MTGKSYKPRRLTNHSVFLYKEEVTSQVVAQTGIPSDRFHLGKLILHSLKDAPDFVLQIDGALNKSETNRSVLERSVRCAIALKTLGLQRGDVIVFMGRNHLDLAIAIYAALYIGASVAGVDITLGVLEQEATFKLHHPKLVFCQTDKAAEVNAVLGKLNYKTEVITFDKGDKFSCFNDILQENADRMPVEHFKPTDFDPEETIAFLTSTSGSTGLPKAAMITHKNLAISTPYFLANFNEFPTPTRMYFFVSPLQWLTAGLQYILSPIFRYTRLQTSAPVTKEHVYDLINRYKPSSFYLSPALMSTLVATGDVDKCDFSSFEIICIGGCQLSDRLLATIKTIIPQADIYNSYGMSEGSGLVFAMEKKAYASSIGRPVGHLQIRIVDPSTLEDIEEPNVSGELWLKGPSIFKGYYNNPEATKEVFSEDGWLKTGDLVYRDSCYNFFFVDRIKMLLKYKNHHISPTELEAVISRHPGVQDVIVVGVLDEEGNDLATACVVPRPGHSVTAQEVKDLVKENLADSKNLRGGVIFMKELPMLPTTKPDRNKLKNLLRRSNVN